MAKRFSVPRSIYVLTYLLVAFAVFAVQSKAQTTSTWNDGTGLWSNAHDWTPNGVPHNGGGNFYNVVINGTGSDTITFDSTGTVINSLSLGSGETLQDNGHSPTLTIGDPAFPMAGTLTNAGTINWSNGSTLILDVTAGGGITNTGTIDIDNSTLKVKGDFGSNQGSLILQNGSLGTINGAFNDVSNVSEATVSVDHSSLLIKGDYNDGSYLGSSNPTLSVADGGTLKIGGNYNGNFSNVSISSGSSATVLGSFNNPLNLVVDGSSLIVKKDLNEGSGVCCYSSSVSIQNDSNLLVHGNVNVGGESFLTLSGGSNGLISGNLDNFDSTVSLANSTLVVKGNYSTETIGFNYLLNGSHLVVDGSLQIDTNGSTGFSFLNLTGSGNTAIINGGVTNGGTLEVDAGSVFTVKGGGFANVSSFPPGSGLPVGTVNLAGAMNVKGGFTNNGGSVMLTPTGTLMTDTYAQSGGLTDVSGSLVAKSYQQTAGSTVIETGGIVTANTFNATGGTVTVNGILDPTAVELGSRGTLQGSGIVNGNVFNHGNIIAGTLGNPLTFNINGNYTQNATGIFTELIGSKGNGLLNVSGAATLVPGASLNVQLVGGFDPKNGTTFTLMDYGSEKGTFTLSDPYFDNGKQQWAVSYGTGGSDDIFLTAEATKVVTPEPSTMFLVGSALLGMVGYAKKKRAR